MLPQNRRTAQMFIALWHSLETFIFIFCNLRKSPNDKKLHLCSGILSCVKEFFLLWPTSILIRFYSEVSYFSYSVQFCIFQLVFQTFFCIFFHYFISVLQDFDFFVFSSRYSRFTPACLGINFLWVRHHPNTEHPICQFCAAFSISTFTFPFSHFHFLLLPKSNLFNSMETLQPLYLEIPSVKEKVELTIQ